MLLFAKKSFRASPAAMLRRLQEKVLARSGPAPEAAREWLVAAGQIEQAVLDAGGPPAIASVTDQAAEVFLASMTGTDGCAASPLLLEAIGRADAPLAEVEVRIPEGYAWYALYPESYAYAAWRWAAAHRGARVAVIGIRSIGTSLSAVVAAALRRAGAEVVDRGTVRPEGHPFARRTALARPDGADFAIIVDEGPGLSGSSMAGAADALHAAGMREDGIVFFPGHDKGPGAAVTAGARRWWTPERCWVSTPPGFVAAAPGVHWMFGGFAAVNEALTTRAEAKRTRQAALARHGLALPSPGSAHGWIALAGEGTPLEARDLSPALITRTLGPYVLRAARSATGCGEQLQAVTRIRDALAAAGIAAGDAADRVAAAFCSLPLAGDGRMAPDQWLRLADGRVLKRDATGADCEHDWAGQQSVLWDVAGAMVEWAMPEDVRGIWCERLAAGGLAVGTHALAFHEAGYCCLGLARARHQGDGREAARYDAGLRRAVATLDALR